jgi:hypothetical protein
LRRSYLVYSETPWASLRTYRRYGIAGPSRYGLHAKRSRHVAVAIPKSPRKEVCLKSCNRTLSRPPTVDTALVKVSCLSPANCDGVSTNGGLLAPDGSIDVDVLTGRLPSESEQSFSGLAGKREVPVSRLIVQLLHIVHSTDDAVDRLPTAPTAVAQRYG